jgi:hypothetical protein
LLINDCWALKHESPIPELHDRAGRTQVLDGEVGQVAALIGIARPGMDRK